MGSGINGLFGNGIRDQSSGIWDYNPWDRDLQCFVESGIKIRNVFGMRDQNSQRFWDQGSKFSGRNTGSVMKKYTSLRPWLFHTERYPLNVPMWHCDIANVRKIDYSTLTPSLLSLNLVRKLWCCDAHKLQGPIPYSPNRAPSVNVAWKGMNYEKSQMQSTVTPSTPKCGKDITKPWMITKSS